MTVRAFRKSHFVNAFLTITEWSYAARTLLICGLLLPFHLGYFVMTWLLFDQTPSLVNFELLQVVLSIWLIVLLALSSMSAWMVHQGSDARWPVYMLIFGFGSVMFGFVYLFGAMGSPYVAYYILSALSILVIFDARSGAVALAYAFAGSITMAFAESKGLIAPAPGFVMRSVDVMHDARWTVTTGVWIAMVFCFLYLIIWMVTASRLHAMQQLEESKAEVERLSITDALTGLGNRRRLDQHLKNEIERASRTNATLALMIADVDHFKQINDKYGHLAGDRSLQMIANLLSGGVRQYDLVARFGGEEFVIIAPDMTGQSAIEMAERLRSKLESASQLEQPFMVTVSFGVASYRLGDSSTTLIERADTALYRAKAAGRNRVFSTA